MSTTSSRRVALWLATALLAAVSALWWRWGAGVFVSGLGSGLC